MLKTTLKCGVTLDCCVYNASGPRTGSKNLLAAIGKSRAGCVVSKSATLLEQSGNDHPRYLELDLGEGCPGSINSEGLPNKGIDYYIDPDLIAAVSATGKPYVLSLSGLSLSDNLEMLRRAAEQTGISAIELNLACPNIPGKPTMAYDFDQMDTVLAAVFAEPCLKANTWPLGVKLAPYFDMPHFERAAEILNKYPVAFVVCTNTIGNALIVDADTEEAVIAPKGGFGGLGGGYIKQTALANVRQMSQRLKSSIDVIGAGGVSRGLDAFELILCGAAAVQVGTRHYKEGPDCFTRIAGELEVLMTKKGYTSISEFRGKLKPRMTKGSSSKAELDKPAKPASNMYMVFLHVAVAVLGMLVVCLSGVGDLKTLLMGRT